MFELAGSGGPWRWRKGSSGRGRKPKPRFISFNLHEIAFVPYINGNEAANKPIFLAPDELEALRLVYYIGLNQEEAAKRMGISRGTLWRLLDSGRKKVVSAVIEGRPLIVSSFFRSLTE